YDYQSHYDIHDVRDRSSQAHWRLTESHISNAWVNLICSTIGYILMVLLIGSCWKRGVLRKRTNDIFFVLLVALIADVVEYRVDVFVIFDLQYRPYSSLYYGHLTKYPTTTAQCSWVNYFRLAYCFVVYAEATVVLRRFCLQFCRFKFTARSMLIGFLIFSIVKMCCFIGSFYYGRVTAIAISFCDKMYVDDTLVGVWMVIWFGSLVITPLLSIATLIGQLIKSKGRIESEVTVTLFFLISSLATGLFVLFPLVLRHEGTISVILMIIQDFRFLFFVILMGIVVTDVRESIIASIRRLMGKEEKHSKEATRVPVAELEEVCLITV
ncbi:hypothetical protein PFISCL1PPCAC_18894, partial [Pristionchus fissidentatus]